MAQENNQQCVLVHGSVDGVVVGSESVRVRDGVGDVDHLPVLQVGLVVSVVIPGRSATIYSGLA